HVEHRLLRRVGGAEQKLREGREVGQLDEHRDTDLGLRLRERERDGGPEGPVAHRAHPLDAQRSDELGDVVGDEGPELAPDPELLETGEVGPLVRRHGPRPEADAL
ncbi:MAG: hypothetical protein ACK559_27685, partial [bacterium]